MQEQDLRIEVINYFISLELDIMKSLANQMYYSSGITSIDMDTDKITAKRCNRTIYELNLELRGVITNQHIRIATEVEKRKKKGQIYCPFHKIISYNS